MNTGISPKTKGTKQLFKNPILEKLSRTHIAVPVVIFIVYSGALLYWSITQTSLTPLVSVFMFVLGTLAFTWLEYIVHRWVFHMKTYSAIRAKWQYMI